MNVVRTLIILLSISFVWTSSSSIGSEFESTLSCSKFHFEEKVLEKLVRLEHKMQILEEKMDSREMLNTAKLDEISNIMDIKDTQIQEQTRFNKSYQEIVEHFKIKATNETDIYGDQINTLLEYFSSKVEVFTEPENKRESVSELMQFNIDREQKRFNSSYDQIVENFKESSKTTLLELIVNHQKEFTEMMEKKEAVAFSAYRSRSQTLQHGEKVIFDGVWTNVENGYEPSTGVFKTPHPGLYHLTAVVMSDSGSVLVLYLCHNESYMTRRLLSGDGYKTGTFDV
ncbi:Hypothetical predicted protein, partial [Mytilus galloprovincialis]